MLLRSDACWLALAFVVICANAAQFKICSPAACCTTAATSGVFACCDLDNTAYCTDGLHRFNFSNVQQVQGELYVGPANAGYAFHYHLVAASLSSTVCLQDVTTVVADSGSWKISNSADGTCRAEFGAGNCTFPDGVPVSFAQPDEFVQLAIGPANNDKAAFHILSAGDLGNVSSFFYHIAADCGGVVTDVTESIQVTILQRH